MPASQTAATERRNERMVSVYILSFPSVVTPFVSAGNDRQKTVRGWPDDECLRKRRSIFSVEKRGWFEVLNY